MKTINELIENVSTPDTSFYSNFDGKHYFENAVGDILGEDITVDEVEDAQSALDQDKTWIADRISELENEISELQDYSTTFDSVIDELEEVKEYLTNHPKIKIEISAEVTTEDEAIALAVAAFRNAQ